MNKEFDAQLRALEEETICNVNLILKEKMGEPWLVNYISFSSMTFGMRSDKEGVCQFGTEVTVLYERRGRRGERNFYMNFGTTGRFSLRDIEEETSRMNFYIGIGKLLDDKETLDKLQSLLFRYADEADKSYFD